MLSPPLLLMLFTISVMCLGTNYIYDFPGTLGVGGHSIQSRFADHDKTYTQTMNQALYSSYSFPNTILACVGGVLVDQVIGLRRATILYALIALCGSIFFLLGVHLSQYPLLVAGRICLGGGCESLGVAQTAWNAKWLKGKKGFVIIFGFATAIQRLGSFLNFILSPRIAASAGVVTAAGMGVVSVAVSLLCAVIVLRLDTLASRRSQQIAVTGYPAVASPGSENGLDDSDDPDSDQKSTERAAARVDSLPSTPRDGRDDKNVINGVVHVNAAVVNAAVDESSALLQGNKESLRSSPASGGCSAITGAFRKVFTNAFKLPFRYWVLAWGAPLVVAAVNLILGVGKPLLMRKFDMNPVTASTITSLIPLMPALAGPFFGALGEMSWATNVRAIWLATAAAAVQGAIALLAFAPHNTCPPEVPLLLMGLSLSAFMVRLWPTINQLVESTQTGVASGIVVAMFAWTGAAMRLVVGHILDNNSDGTRDDQGVLLVHCRRRLAPHDRVLHPGSQQQRRFARTEH
jgi:MFS family permease